MKKILPYLLIIVILLIAAGIYIQKTSKNLLKQPSQTNTNNPSPTADEKPQFTDLGPAPEFTGITKWLNSPPLTMASLAGKVVLVDFWTYSCINCIRTLPYVTKWYDTYKDKGFVVIGVHAPEFAFEKDSSNVTRAIKQFNIHYPVAQDNDLATWNAFNNQYWPAEYLINKEGHIVYTHFGEGNYTSTESAIQSVLGLQENLSTSNTTAYDLTKVKSPEMYFGLSRLQYLTTAQQGSAGTQDFIIPNRLEQNAFALSGRWTLNQESAHLEKGPGKIKLHFYAAKVHIVAASAKQVTVKASVDSFNPTFLNIKESSLYTLFDSNNYGDHVLELEIPDGGFDAFTFTFG